MKKQMFVFNPMQMNSPRSSVVTKQHHDEHLSNGFGPIGSNVHHQKIQTKHLKEPEPLLLSSVTNMRQLKDQENRPPRNEERLASLNSQLYQQTENIRKWMISTDIQISEKDRKIEEATKTIDSLRKSILELQFMNENVSSKLHDEKTLHEETIQKITTTRNMCNALKEHLVKLEKGVILGENMLTVQKQESKQTVDQYQELLFRFQELEIKVTGKEYEMENALKNNQDKYNEESERLQNKILESEEGVQMLKEMNLKYENEIGSKNEKIAFAQQEFTMIKNEYANLQDLLEKANKTIEKHEALIEETKKEHEQITKDIQDSERRNMVAITELKNACKNKDEEIQTILEDLKAKNMELVEKKEDVSKHTEILEVKSLEIEEMVEKIEQAIKVKDEMEFHISDLSNKLEDVEQQLKGKESEVKECKNMIVENQDIIRIEQHLNEKLSNEIKDVETKLATASESAIELKILKIQFNTLKTAKEELQSQANFALSQVEEMATQLEELNVKNETLEEEMLTDKESLEKNNIEQKKLQTDLKTKDDELQDKIGELGLIKEEADQLKAKLEELCQERELNAESLEEIMGSRDKKIESSEKKVNTLQTKISAKVKLVNKLTVDVKTLKSQLKIEEKAKKKLAEDIAKTLHDLDQLQKDKLAFHEEAMGKEKVLMDELEGVKLTVEQLDAEKDQLKHQAESSLQQCEKASHDLDQAKLSFDAQITEMCRTLEKYKMENEKLMNAREKELDKKTKALAEAKDILEEQLQGSRLQLENYSVQVLEKDKAIANMKNETEYLNSKVSELEKQLKKAKEKADVRTVVAKEKAERNATNKNNPGMEIMTPKYGMMTTKIPKTSQMETLSSIPKSVTPRTPQGILRYSEGKTPASKRVVFNVQDSEEMSEDENPLYRQKSSGGTTLKPASKVISVRPTARPSPKIAVPKCPSNSFGSKSSINPEKRIKRADDSEANEIEKFRKLFPDGKDGMPRKIPKEKAGGKKNPFKSKLKKVVPRTKKGTAAVVEKMDFSWFDSNAAFGFGIEE